MYVRTYLHNQTHKAIYNNYIIYELILATIVCTYLNFKIDDTVAINILQ